VALSWIVTHTAYTFVTRTFTTPVRPNGGLEFRAHRTPCDMDFAYYCFTLGMCFQVSDVQCTAPDIRRATAGARAVFVSVQHHDFGLS